MVEVKLAEPCNWSTAIKGSWGSASLGVGLGGHVKASNIEKGIKTDHVHGHGVGPFKDLRADIHKKCIRGPSSKDHDLGGAMIHKQEFHGSSRTNRSVPDPAEMKSKGFLAAVE
jgi:hypothetical protein